MNGRKEGMKKKEKGRTSQIRGHEKSAIITSFRLKEMSVPRSGKQKSSNRLGKLDRINGRSTLIYATGYFSVSFFFFPIFGHARYVLFMRCVRVGKI